MSINVTKIFFDASYTFEILLNNYKNVVNFLTNLYLFIKHVICANYYVEWFIFLVLTTSMGQMLLLSLERWGKWDPKRLKNLPQFTKLLSCQARILTFLCLTPIFMLLTMTLYCLSENMWCIFKWLQDLYI